MIKYMFTINYNYGKKKEQYSFLKSVSREFELENIQRYFPILSDFLKYRNNFDKKFKILDNKYIVRRLNSTLDEFDNNYENQNKKFFGEIKNNNKKFSKIFKKDIFTKVNSILDPMCYMMGYYSKPENIFIPTIKNKIKFDKYTFKKVNTTNNTAYIDTFSTFILSKLVENNKTCAFPLYYNSFVGIKKNFYYNITEEYDSIKKTDWFYEGINKKKYNIHCFKKNIDLNNDFEELDDYDSEEYPIVNIKCVNGDEYTNDPFVVDNNNNNLKNELDDLIDIDIDSDIDNIYDSGDDYSQGSLDLNDNDYMEEYYLEMKNVPVTLTFMEAFDNTLEDLCKTDVSEDELICHLFQICFGLSIAQKEYDFYHNDLHTANIMYNNTTDAYIYYKVQNIYFKIPSYGKIMKIIDFGRAIFTVNSKTYFSDVFEYDGEAYGQYTYPVKDFSKKKVLPNKSFDLSRLSTTLLDDIPKLNSDNTDMLNLKKLLIKWVTDKYGKDVRRYEEFDLYKIIARRMDNAIPIEQLSDDIFKKYIITKKEIPDNIIIYEI